MSSETRVYLFCHFNFSGAFLRVRGISSVFLRFSGEFFQIVYKFGLEFVYLLLFVISRRACVRGGLDKWLQMGLENFSEFSGGMFFHGVLVAFAVPNV